MRHTLKTVKSNMSSFNCSSKHFNSIEYSIKMLALGNEFYFPYEFKTQFSELYDKKHYSTERIEKCVTEVIDTLRELNVLCVSLQYKHHYEGKLDAEIAEQKEIVRMGKDFKSLSLMELYAALKCVNYQIELEHLKELRELTFEERQAMFFVETMINALAHEIVNKLPAYQNVSWEIN